MKKEMEYTEEEINMRWRFAQQAIRFWRKSTQNNEHDWEPAEEACRNLSPGNLQNERLAYAV
ncbi:MAG: hypothetical protein BA861_03265 [Desulfobacterales bacterium S3730MH5]|nr:MAG: hypothetical protein BA861_03265 [Desulfobacterales bacterium S3730MH5]